MLISVVITKQQLIMELARILLIEDDEMISETLVLVLNQRGYLVEVNETGKDVIALMESFKPDLILLDIMLGDIDGRDVCRELKEHPVHHIIPIIVISASPEVYNSISFEGANDVILKPFTEDILITRVERQLLNSQRSMLNQTH